MLRSALIVDDDLTSLELLSKVLSKRGFQTTTAQDGAEASQILMVQEFHIVISDVQMQEIDGFQLLDKILARNENSKIILLSAYVTKRIVQNALNRGAFEILSKPVDPTRLLEVIERALKASVKKKSLGLPENVPLAEDPDNNEQEPAGETFDRLVEEIGIDSVRDLTEIFKKNSELMLKQIEETLQKRNLDFLAGLAHKFRGACLNMGLIKAALLCRELQDQCKQGKRKGLEDLTESLNETYRLEIAFLCKKLRIEGPEKKAV